MVWWAWLCVSALFALGAVFFAVLGMSAGTAYGANYHAFSSRQRVMGKALYTASSAAALFCAAITLFGVFSAAQPLLE